MGQAEFAVAVTLVGGPGAALVGHVVMVFASFFSPLLCGAEGQTQNLIFSFPPRFLPLFLLLLPSSSLFCRNELGGGV